MKLRELATLIGGDVIGDPEVEITGVAGIADAQTGDITYIHDKKFLRDTSAIHASAVIVKEAAEGLSASMLIVKNPQYTYAKALEVFYEKPSEHTGVSDRAFIGDNVILGDKVSVHHFACICDHAVIGAGATISSGVYIEDGVTIGDNTLIYPNVTLRGNTKIGNNVTIHSGAVIGSDGFGYVMEQGMHYKIPQVGGVIIEDNVEIGSNVTIDRGTTGNTFIGSGTKIDNLVQVGHNVTIGSNSIIISQVGISGSVDIGDSVILAGQVGVRDHITIGNRAIVGAQSGIGGNIPEGQVYSGSPAIPHKSWLRAQSIYSKLPEYAKRIQELERKLEDITGKKQDT
jgi:UDP-3-O-[3-hydroxymyristoyl] glucosamine N-acyltransferase